MTSNHKQWRVVPTTPFRGVAPASRKVIIAVRDPVARLVSAFSMLTVLMPKDKRPPTGRRLFECFGSANDFALALVLRNGSSPHLGHMQLAPWFTPSSPEEGGAAWADAEGLGPPQPNCTHAAFAALSSVAGRHIFMNLNFYVQNREQRMLSSLLAQRNYVLVHQVGSRIA